jgi:hypothetical protein
MLTVIDQFSRRPLLIEPRLGFGGRDVVAALVRVIGRTGTPLSITGSRGAEFTYKTLEERAHQKRREPRLHAS